jgi:hypothetical protein
MTDLKAFTHDLVSQVESDLGTGLDWVAIDHWNTDNPHVQTLARPMPRAFAMAMAPRPWLSSHASWKPLLRSGLPLDLSVRRL